LIDNPLNSINEKDLKHQLTTKFNMVKNRMHDKQEDIKDLETIFETLRKRVFELSEQNIHRLMTELETGGNIRFEEGKLTEKW